MNYILVGLTIFAQFIIFLLGIASIVLIPFQFRRITWNIEHEKPFSDSITDLLLILLVYVPFALSFLYLLGRLSEAYGK